MVSWDCKIAERWSLVRGVIYYPLYFCRSSAYLKMRLKVIGSWHALVRVIAHSNTCCDKTLYRKQANGLEW